MNTHPVSEILNVKDKMQNWKSNKYDSYNIYWAFVSCFCLDHKVPMHLPRARLFGSAIVWAVDTVMNVIPILKIKCLDVRAKDTKIKYRLPCQHWCSKYFIYDCKCTKQNLGKNLCNDWALSLAFKSFYPCQNVWQTV